MSKPKRLTPRPPLFSYLLGSADIAYEWGIYWQVVGPKAPAAAS